MPRASISSSEPQQRSTAKGTRVKRAKSQHLTFDLQLSAVEAGNISGLLESESRGAGLGVAVDQLWPSSWRRRWARTASYLSTRTGPRPTRKLDGLVSGVLELIVGELR
jgi:hypothetical protein